MLEADGLFIRERKKTIYGDVIKLVVVQIPTTIPFFHFFITPPPPQFSDSYIFPVRESDYQPNMQLLMEHMRGSRIFFQWEGP